MKAWSNREGRSHVECDGCPTQALLVLVYNGSSLNILETLPKLTYCNIQLD